MSDNKQMKIFTLEQFEAEMEEFANTSIWTYLNRGDQENVERKILKNIWYPVTRFFSDIYYWFVYRFHPKHQYHVVSTGLPPGYFDTDHRMFHCCFNLLKEYVEFELGGIEKLSRWENKSWETEGFSSKKEYEEYVDLDREMREIYNFWVNVRPAREDPYENWNKRDNFSWDLSFKIDQEYDRQDQDMLLRLIKIREHLWI